MPVGVYKHKPNQGFQKGHKLWKLANHKGQTAWNKDKHLSDVHRKHLSESHIGKIGYWFNKKRSPETIKKISESKKGKPSWNKNFIGWKEKYPQSGFQHEHPVFAGSEKGRFKKDMMPWNKNKKCPQLNHLGTNYGGGYKKGHTVSKETIKKMRQTKSLNPTRFWLGKKRSKETIERIRKTCKGKHNSPKTEFKRGRIGVNYKQHRPSKPQKQLYEFTKRFFPDAILEFPIQTLKSIRFADIAIPSLKIDVEYDGEHWHKNKEKDLRRDEEIEEQGWRVIRFGPEVMEVIR